MKKEEDGVSQVHRELHSLVEREVQEGGIGAEPMHKLLMLEGAYCMGVGQNTYTLERCLDTWVENFRQNLDKIRNAGQMLGPITDPNAMLVVGAGPSAREASFSFIKDCKRRPIVFCTNKSLSYLLRDGIEPDVVAVLHSTDEIRGTIRTNTVMDYIRDKGEGLRSKFMVPTTVDPGVYEEIRRITHRDNMIWFNPSVPDEHVQNVSVFMERMSGCPTIDSGGNVGIFALWLALSSSKGNNVIGTIGLEHCLRLDMSWSNEQAKRYRIEFMPECGENALYAIPPSFQTYIEAMVGLCRRMGGGQVYNLVPYGPVYARKLISYMPMEAFKCQFLM